MEVIPFLCTFRLIVFLFDSLPSWTFLVLLCLSWLNWLTLSWYYLCLFELARCACMCYTLWHVYTHSVGDRCLFTKKINGASREKRILDRLRKSFVVVVVCGFFLSIICLLDVRFSVTSFHLIMPIFVSKVESRMARAKFISTTVCRKKIACVCYTVLFSSSVSFNLNFILFLSIFLMFLCCMYTYVSSLNILFSLFFFRCLNEACRQYIKYIYNIKATF